MSTFTVRTTADGDHYFEPRTFTSQDLAEACYDSTVRRVAIEDPADAEVSISLIDDETDDVLAETTFPRGVFY